MLTELENTSCVKNNIVPKLKEIRAVHLDVWINVDCCIFEFIILIEILQIS